MSTGEVYGRLRHGLYQVFERWQVARPSDRDDKLRGAASGSVGRTHSWRDKLLEQEESGFSFFFTSAAERTELREVLRTHYPAGAERAIARARRCVQGEVELFGRCWTVTEPIDWHRAPGRSHSWHREYHGDLAVTGSEETRGDVKEVWELNRHQVLVDLGKAWLLEEDRAYLDRVRAIVLSWIADDPYGIGVNWAGPLEVAYRALSWMWAYGLVRDALDEDEHLTWMSGFLDHGRFLHQHLELFSSPYNHLIGEASVLYMLGVLFPQFQESYKWRRRGRHVLECRLPMQFNKDGGSVEQATVYHHATLGFYLLAALAGRRAGEELCPEVWSAIERATEFTMWMAQPDGRQPSLGDNDDAWPILFDRTDAWDYRHFLSMGAVLFNRGDFKHVADGLAEEGVWLLGPAAIDRFQRVDAHEPVRRSVALPDAGYVVLRNGWHSEADYVCFDCGEQAGGLRHDSVASAAHGHADCLSVVVSLGGTPVLVDAGFYTYNGDREWERFFRETAAHSTVRVDDSDQARHLEKMSWSHAPVVTVEATGLQDGRLWATAAHDGYARRPNGLVHRRSTWLRDGYIAIGDELRGAGAHDVELIFQFGPAWTPVIGDRELTAGDWCWLGWATKVPVAHYLCRGGPGPEGGWVAPALGLRVPAARVVLRSRVSEPCSMFLSVLADLRRWQVRERGAESGLSIELCRGDATETVSFGLAQGPDEGSAPVLTVRRRGASAETVESASGSTTRAGSA